MFLNRLGLYKETRLYFHIRVIGDLHSYRDDGKESDVFFGLNWITKKAHVRNDADLYAVDEKDARKCSCMVPASRSK